MAETRARWRFRLPHWEVTGRPHFVTIRCAGSLPQKSLDCVREIQAALHSIEPRSPQFAALQRQYFLTCERYLDAGHGHCPFHDRNVCDVAVASLREFPQRKGWHVPHFTLMPNPVHLLLVPGADAQPLRQAVRGWKWHVAIEANRLLGRTGPFWQTDWFDRWARTDAEFIRMRDYIRQNPVQARLVSRWQDYPYTKSEVEPESA